MNILIFEIQTILKYKYNIVTDIYNKFSNPVLIISIKFLFCIVKSTFVFFTIFHETLYFWIIIMFKYTFVFFMIFT